MRWYACYKHGCSCGHFVFLFKISVCDLNIIAEVLVEMKEKRAYKGAESTVQWCHSLESPVAVTGKIRDNHINEIDYFLNKMFWRHTIAFEGQMVSFIVRGFAKICFLTCLEGICRSATQNKLVVQLNSLLCAVDRPCAHTHVCCRAVERYSSVSSGISRPLYIDCCL